MTQRLDVTLAGLHQLHTRIGQHALDDGDWPVVGGLVQNLIVREESKLERMIAKIASAKTDNSPGDVIDVEHTSINDEANGSAPNEPATEPAQNTESGAADASPSRPGPNDNKTDSPRKGKGHGRNGAKAYTKATHIFHALMAGILGSLCVCRKAYMTKYREKVIIRVLGQPLFGAEVHHYEQVRCKMCGKIIRALGTAKILEGIGTSYVTYDWSACAMLIVMHYFAGAPFKRLESLHAGWGMPMADANQWNIVNQSDDLLLPLYNALEVFGMKTATSLRIDDTGSMIVQIMRQIQAEISALELLGQSTKNVRTGINATGVYLETPNGTVILFFTGRHHAGEILDLLLKHRQAGGPKLVKVTDGASKNFNHEHEDRLIEGLCNAHALLKFRNVKGLYPEEYAIAGAVYKQVFDNDDIAKARGMTPEARMVYHRKNSLPLMQKLKTMCEAKITSRLVEANSKLWVPVTFILNQWPRLTKFCEAPGVPLDTNLVEQILIMQVRYLAGSFNFQTPNGAEVGDRHMSLVATARANGAEPVSYLKYCLENHEDLAKRPEYYLPWVYMERLKQAADKPPAKIQEAAAS